jgi:vacuolar protein sorting-associated protein 13A/C
MPVPPSLASARAFASARAALRSRVASASETTETVEFLRIWWDKRSKHPSLTKVGFWRPVPPPGYVALGDCMVTGMYAPPKSVLVLRDTDPAEALESGAPLLKPPLCYVMVRARTRAGREGALILGPIVFGG